MIWKRKKKASIRKIYKSSFLPTPCWVLTWPLGFERYYVCDTWEEAVRTFNTLRRKWA